MCKIIKLLPIYMGLFALTFTSCEKEENVVPQSVFYISNQVSPVNELSFQITYYEKQDSISIKGDTIYKFVVRATMPVKERTVIKCMPNETLVKEYNEQNASEYLFLSNKYYTIEKDEVVIEPDEMVSKDSIVFKFNSKADLRKIEELSLLPIQITSVNNKNNHISTNLNSIRVFGIKNDVLENVDPENQKIDGEPIDRSEWEIKAKGAYAWNPPKREAHYMLDGDVNTCWFTASSNPFILLDMKSLNKDLKGITLTPNRLFGLAYNPTEIEVLTSNNNKSWTTQGVYRGEIPSVGDINIKFKKTVVARFIRLNLRENNGQFYTGVAELNVIK